MGHKAPLRVVVEQPQFLPWIGYWHKVVSCDLLIVYAGVKFDQYDHEHRVTLGGSWLTAPVEGHSRKKLIKDVRLADAAWGKHAVEVIRQRVGWKRAPYRDRLDGLLSALSGWRCEWLLDLDLMLFVQLADALGLPVIWTVDRDPRPDLDKTGRLDACLGHHLGQARLLYLQGAAGRSYMGFDTLKTPTHGTLFQEVREGVSEDSVLQLIAYEPCPLTAVQDAGVWCGLRGKTDWKGSRVT